MNKILKDIAFISFTNPVRDIELSKVTNIVPRITFLLSDNSQCIIRQNIKIDRANQYSSYE